MVNAEDQKLHHVVTTIRSAEAQLGENVIRALQHTDTVAVLTTVVVGPDGRQQIISASLNPSLMNHVQQILLQAQAEREPEDPCIGFHCLVEPKQGNASESPST